MQTLTHIFCQQVTVLYWNARWRPPPSWIWSLFHIRCKCWILHSSTYFDVKCGENRCNGSKVTVLFLNSRWRSPPSWILWQLRIWLLPRVERYRTYLEFKFGKNRSNSSKVTHFVLNQDGGRRHLEFQHKCKFDQAGVQCVTGPTWRFDWVNIGPTVQQL